MLLIALEFVGVLEGSGAFFEFLLLTLQVPEVEHLTAIDQPLGADQFEHLLAEHQRGDDGLVIFEEGAGFEHLEAGRGDELFKDRAIEDGAFADRRGLVPDEVVLEEAEKEILQQRAEMGDQTLAGFDQIVDGRGGEAEFMPCTPVVAIAFDP